MSVFHNFVLSLFSFQVGRLPLHYAANAGRLDAVRFLVVDCSCPVDARDSVSSDAIAIICSNAMLLTCNWLGQDELQCGFIQRFTTLTEGCDLMDTCCVIYVNQVGSKVKSLKQASNMGTRGSGWSPVGIVAQWQNAVSQRPWVWLPAAPPFFLVL